MTTTQELETVTAQPTAISYMRRHLTDLILPLGLAAEIAFGLAMYPSFRSVGSFVNILIFSSILLIVAVGETFVVIGRGADLSVGSMVGLSGAVLAVLVIGGWPWPLAIAATLILALLIGLGHGLLITKMRISFLIVTLGTFALLRSQTNVVLGSRSQTVRVPFLETLAIGRTWHIPNLVIVAAGIYIVATLVLRKTGFGRSLYAVGSSPEAARLAGIPVARVTIIAFVISAVAAAIAGLLTVGSLGSAQTTAGSGLELAALSAVLLGGTRFSGGFGSATRTLVGVLFLGVLNSLLYTAGVGSAWQGTASGLVLIAAVALDRTRKD